MMLQDDDKVLLLSCSDNEFDSLVDYVRYLNTQNITGRENRKLVKEFLERRARRQGIPLHGTFELTPFCNLDCKMCYVHLEKEAFHNNQLLPIDQWKLIMEHAFKAGMRQATLTGGECLTYPGFDELFLFLCRLGVRVSVLSNGTLIGPKLVEFFKKNPPDHIQISLYGSSDDAYEKVTRHRVFTDVYRNIQLLKKAGIKTQLSITPNRFMIEDMRQLVELTHSISLPYNINCRLIQPRINTGRVIEDLSIDQYIDIYRIRAELSNTKLYSNDPCELPEKNCNAHIQKGLLCGAGRSGFAISYDGYMMPCVSLEEISAPVLDLGFEKAWEIIHREASTCLIPGECNSCAYFPVCISCQAQHKSAPAGHCNPQICERTRKLVEAGFYHYRGKSALVKPDT